MRLFVFMQMQKMVLHPLCRSSFDWVSLSVAITLEELFLQIDSFT